MQRSALLFVWGRISAPDRKRKKSLECTPRLAQRSTILVTMQMSMQSTTTSVRIIDVRYRKWLIGLVSAAASSGLLVCLVLSIVLRWWPTLYSWLLCLPFMGGAVWLLAYAPDLLAKNVKVKPAQGQQKSKKPRPFLWLWGATYLFRYVWYVIPIVIMAAANGFVFEGKTFDYIAGMVATLCTPILAFVATAIVFWCDVNKPQREVLYAATGDSLTAD